MSNNDSRAAQGIRNVSRLKELENATASITETSSKIGEAILAWKKSTDELASLAPSRDKINAEIAEIQKQLDSSHTALNAKITEFKRKKGGATDKAIKERLPNKIKGWIEEEVEKQVGEHFDRKLNSMLPVPVEQQTKDLDKRTTLLKLSLLDSRARASNAHLTLQSGLDSLIERVLMSNSDSASKIFPGNLRTFFYYDDDEIKRLCTDYDLPVSETKTVNMQRFLGHIGVRNILIPTHVPMVSGAKE